MLPAQIRDLAARLGAAAATTSVTLTQSGRLRGRPRGRALRFTARQVIRTRQPEFVWRAALGPFGCIAVTDALERGRPLLEVRALRFLRLARVSGGAAAAKGEIMRYLAELAWAPDAILGNERLIWRVAGERDLSVSLDCGGASATVDLRLDEAGRIASVAAPDRPRRERGGFVERPWHGRFRDYRRHAGRWLPFRGEVGWVLDGSPFVAWEGEITGWSATAAS